MLEEEVFLCKVLHSDWLADDDSPLNGDTHTGTHYHSAENPEF